MTLTITTLAQAPQLQAQIEPLHDSAWPRYICEFMRQDARISHQWEQLHLRFGEFQLLFCDASQQVIAIGHSIPVYWDQTLQGLPAGWEDVLKWGIEGHQTPNTLSALAVIVDPRYQKQGLSQQVIMALRKVAQSQQFRSLIAPVRPILKHQYPLISMDQYVTWQRSQLPFDPWIRVHAKLGARILSTAPHSMVIPASVAQWESWTGLQFPGDGSYLVPGALQPITVDHQQNCGIYQEANVWMRHEV
jgi:GNAT superfamily N-acetyltransferase